MLLITDRFKVVAHDEFFLKGKCVRCGECCRRRHCPHLVYETLDGVKLAVCKIYFERPVGCAIWPMKDDDLPESCGFYWEST